MAAFLSPGNFKVSEPVFCSIANFYSSTDNKDECTNTRNKMVDENLAPVGRSKVHSTDCKHPCWTIVDSLQRVNHASLKPVKA